MSLPLPTRMEDDAIAVAAAAALSVAVALFKVISKGEHNQQRQRQPRFYRAALLRAISLTSHTPWKQFLNFEASSDFLVALNFDTDTNFFNILLPHFEKC